MTDARWLATTTVEEASELWAIPHPDYTNTGGGQIAQDPKTWPPFTRFRSHTTRPTFYPGATPAAPGNRDRWTRPCRPHPGVEATRPPANGGVGFAARAVDVDQLHHRCRCAPCGARHRRRAGDPRFQRGDRRDWAGQSGARSPNQGAPPRQGGRSADVGRGIASGIAAADRR